MNEPVYPDGHALVYDYGGAVRVEYAEPGVEMTYLGQGTEPPGDAGDQYTGLDRFGRVVDIRWLKTLGGASLDRFQYGFDRASNRDWRRNRTAPAQDWDEHYTYNGLYELTALARGQLNSTGTGIVGTPAWREDFGFDPTGNWPEYETRVAGTIKLDQIRVHNPANEITAIAGSPALVAYDGVGNMRHMPKVGSWSAGQSLRWDAWNRLVEVREGAGGTGGVVAMYRYDGMTRRITKQNNEGGTWAGRHFYYSDKWQILEERVGSALNPAERQFIWGTRYADHLVLRDRFSSGGSTSASGASGSSSSGGGRQQVRLYATHDQWHVTGVLSQAGAVVERYAYEAFGSPLVLTPAFGARLLSHFDWETRYGAYRWDAETGLYQVRHRYLHAGLGRWSSRDPLGGPLINSLYDYVLNAPVSSADPLGLYPEACCKAIAYAQATEDNLVNLTCCGGQSYQTYPTRLARGVSPVAWPGAFGKPGECCGGDPGYENGEWISPKESVDYCCREGEKTKTIPNWLNMGHRDYEACVAASTNEFLQDTGTVLSVGGGALGACYKWPTLSLVSRRVGYGGLVVAIVSYCEKLIQKDLCKQLVCPK